MRSPPQLLHYSVILSTKKKGRSTIRALAICAAFIFIVDFASDLQFAPTNQLLELSVCRSYYRSVDPSTIAPDSTVLARSCKIDAIQKEVAVLRGWLGLAQALPGMSPFVLPLYSIRATDWIRAPPRQPLRTFGATVWAQAGGGLGDQR